MKKVYICTPLKLQKFRIDQITQSCLSMGVFPFIPTTVAPTNPKHGANLDKFCIENCDELWVFGPIGRDCAWEIGYAQGLEKPVVFHCTEENKHVLDEDWMLTLGNFKVKYLGASKEFSKLQGL